MIRLFILALAAATPWAAFAEPCPGNPDALGTARVITVDVASTPRVGRKHFPATLPLQAKELVLTFDDGPWPTTTPHVLDALKRECVHASFFLLGRNAEAYPQLVKRAAAEGHTIGHHTYSHPLLSHMPLPRADAEVTRGIAADEFALSGIRRQITSTPFFRFPGFAATQPLLDRMTERGLVVFGADVWASDWVPMAPAYQLNLILARIAQVNRGIVLFHDTKTQTAQMIGPFLRALKQRGYGIVHVVPAQPAASENRH
jgi:peptidoglycan/xylan/chitin deacetylase (PgdA/CDA1 family)